MQFLSPGQFHLQVPTDLVGNLLFRKSLLTECLKSQRTRDLVTYACKNDIIFFINGFGWQTNSDMLDEEDGPFICHDFQKDCLLETIRWLIHERRIVVWEKSRKQGGTMLALFLDVWLTLFHRRKKSIILSHNESAVEQSDDEDTLFGKLDFIINHLPSWMQDGMPRKKGVYRMKKTKSQIRGLATTTSGGAGKRATKETLDEFSKMAKAQQVLGHMLDVGPPLVIGTHYGVGGEFYDLCDTRKRPDVHKIVLHWSKNPMYNRGLYYSSPHLKPTERVVDPVNNPLSADYPMVTDGSPHGGPFPGLRSPYYDNICKTRPAREVAMHWDIDPAGASRQLFPPHLIRDLVVKCEQPCWRGDIVYDPVGGFRGLRPITDGPLKLWVKFLPHHQNTGRWITPSYYKVGGDIGNGQGATPSCLGVGDSLNGKKVGEYQYALPPQARPANFARIASALCYLFSDADSNPAQLIWDRTGPTGETFGRALVEIGFRHFWYWRDEFALNPKISDTPGWFASKEGKKLLFEEYEEGLRTGKLYNPSENALMECLAFEYAKSGEIEHGECLRTEDPAAGRLNHSDQAYADALMWKLMIEASQTVEEVEEQTDSDKELVATGYGLPIKWIEENAAGTRVLDPFRR